MLINGNALEDDATRHLETKEDSEKSKLERRQKDAELYLLTDLNDHVEGSVFS